MLHNIEPHLFSQSFSKRPPEADDYAIIIHNDGPVFFAYEGGYRLPFMHEAGASTGIHLFSIDDMHFYLCNSEKDLTSCDGYIIADRQMLRTIEPSYFGFAGALGCQLNSFYANNRFCGKCASKNTFSDKETALVCPNCGTVIYPQISPAVIVAVNNGDKLLLTRYRNGSYKKYALVAGFVEFGETFEEAVVREVHEEVGINIKNLRYYKNQPWPFSNSQMIGFTAELDGDDTLHIQEDELSEALWLPFDEIPDYPDHKVSISEELIERYRVSRAKYILFDLDGTLTDPKEGITKCVQYALKFFDIDVENADDLVCFIGPPLYDSFPEYYGLSKEETIKAVDYYRERFNDVGLFENIVYPDIEDLLRSLKKAGYILAVATSKPEAASIRILEHFHLLEYFTTVVGSELNGTRSKKADVILEVFNRLNIDEEKKSRCVMIGDRKHDIIGAKSCGIRSIGVDYGYAEPGELRDFGANLVVNSVAELRDVFLK